MPDSRSRRIPDVSRRDVLRLAASTAVVATVPVSPVSAADACETYLEVESELESEQERLTSVESESEEVRKEHEELLETVEQRYHEVYGEPRYDEAVHEEAKAVAEDVKDAVVFLDMEYETEFETKGGDATGWFREDGVIVTNAHNVTGAAEDSDPELRAWTAAGEEFEFEIIDFVEDEVPDVAALEADVDPPATIPFGSTSDVSSGDHVLQVGHPGGFGNWVLSLGEVLEKGEDLRTTVPGLKGNSGSPLVNMDGEAVGLTFGGTDEDDSRQPGEAPEPVEPVVHQYPFQNERDALHETIETVESKLEAWI